MISIIVPTRDRAELLEQTLAALIRQECPGGACEIVVVDNGSIDRTPAVVAAAAGGAVPVVYVLEAKPGKSHALNTAVARARGELLVFTDDDVIPSDGWVAALSRALVETGADFATGRILPLWEAPAPRWMSPELYGALSVADAGVHRLSVTKGVNEHIMPLGGNLAIRRHVLGRIGGWNPALGSLQGTLRTGEDHEFGLRMLAAGFRGVYEPGATVRHRVPPERLRVSYFLDWFAGNGAVEAGLEQEFPTTVHYFLNVPRYLWRQFAGDLLRTTLGVLSADPKRVTAGRARMTWFACYFQRRWQLRHRSTGAGVQAATS